MSPAANRLRAYLHPQAVQPSGSIAIVFIATVDELHRQIGELNVENDFLLQKLGF